MKLALLLSLTLSPTLLARTLHVATDGDDTAPGSVAAPLKTISKAAEIAQPGDTVLVRSGVYRERVTPPRGGEPGKPITYRGEKLGTVFIRGSELWAPDWREESGGVFSANPDEALFDDDVYVDSPNPFRVPLSSTPYGRNGKPEHERFGYGRPDLAYTCGQVIVDGKPWEQRPFPTEVKNTPGRWAFEPGEGRVFVCFGKAGPHGRQIEIAARRRVFAPHVRGLGHIVVENFVIEHCGNQYPTNFWKEPKWAQAGMVGLRAGHHWIVRNNLLRYAGTDAISMGSGGGDNERDTETRKGAPLSEDNRIEANYIIDNGAGGVCGSQSKRLVFLGNVVMRNNTQRFTGNKRYEHGGFKAHGIRDALIEGNYFADNPRMDGIWLDNMFPGTRITRNVVVNSGGRGIFLEMSDYRDGTWDTAFVDHNISVGNDIQFYAHDAAGATTMYNLFANSPPDARYGQGAYIYQVGARTNTGYHSLFNNLFVCHKGGIMLDINYPAHRGGPQRLDHNVYDAAPGARAYRINSYSDKPSPWKPAEFLALVKKDIGGTSPQAIDEGKKVALSLAEWRAFWQTHGQKNDSGSVEQQGMVVSYKQETLTLTLDVPFEPMAIGSTPHPKVNTDFFGDKLPPGGKASPGPFQKLKRGENAFRIWDGLPLLGEGELP